MIGGVAYSRCMKVSLAGLKNFIEKERYSLSVSKFIDLARFIQEPVGVGTVNMVLRQAQGERHHV